VTTEDARRHLLFGPDAPLFEGWDELRESERIELVEAWSELTGARGAIETVLITQLLGDDPPQVWATLERLLAAGLAVEAAHTQIRLVLTTVLRDALGHDDQMTGDTPDGPDEPFRIDEIYAERLARLPLPSTETVEQVLGRVAASRRVWDDDELRSAVMAEFDSDPDEPVLGTLLGRVIEEQIEPFGSLCWLAGDRTVHRRTLTTGIVLTHELTALEREADRLALDLDLTAFSHVHAPVLEGTAAAEARRARNARTSTRAAGTAADAVRTEDDVDAGAILTVPGGQWTMSWLGPPGWLAPFPVGALLAVRFDADDVLTIEQLPERPDLDPVLRDAFRRVVETEVAEPGLPLDAAEAVLATLVDHPDAFRTPQPPLRELCDAAGLIRRGDEIGDSEGLWLQASALRRIERVQARADDEIVGRQALLVLDLLDALTLAADTVDEDELDDALDALTDPEVFDLVSAEIMRADADPAPTEATFLPLVLRGRRRERAAAHTLASLHAERAGDLAAAEQHLEAALEADPEHLVAVDRLAWYLSDRGDAARAIRLWSRVSNPRLDRLVTMLRALIRPERAVGRNEPCWCGSGRKYKQCHLGEPDGLPLADRVGWLAAKAELYVERQGLEVWDDIEDLAFVLTGGDSERLATIAQEPLLLDLVLTEGRRFEDFLDERGELLPEDEAALAASWLAVPRSVYEVLEVDPGVGLVLREVASGERLEVPERSPRGWARRGRFVCTRAVPDGQGFQLVGAAVEVPADEVSQVLELCERADPYEFAHWYAELTDPALRRDA
jgi:tetratricopeptide (TPR) repeat protein